MILTPYTLFLNTYVFMGERRKKMTADIILVPEMKILTIDKHFIKNKYAKNRMTNSNDHHFHSPKIRLGDTLDVYVLLMVSKANGQQSLK